ncbi:hypothetical protein K2X30_07300 [bacterium]|jgi:hypothetical protein|nr:hypothetical protein [bacterium]
MKKWALLLIFFTGCSSSLKKGEHLIEHLVVAKTMVRRPVGPGAAPSIGPGGTDYTSHPLPDEKLDCKPIPSIFSGIDLGKLRACLASANPEKDVPFLLYKLHRDPEPFFELVKNEKNPKCMQEVLPRIPLPREIFFVAQKTPEEDNRTRCYATRLNLEADKIFDVKVPRAQVALRLNWPWGQTIKTDAEMLRVLGGWALTPFYDSEKGGFVSQFVTEATCRRCLGDPLYYKELGPTPFLWPAVGSGHSFSGLELSVD